MSAEPIQTQADEDTAFYRAALHELISLGTDLARHIHATALAGPTAPPMTATDPAAAFERVARAVRRTVLLASRLHEAPRPATRAASRQAARKQLIRSLEDAITSEADVNPGRAPALEAEFRERLDQPDLEDDIDTRPVAEIIAEIRHDLGLSRVPGGVVTHCRRRTPADIEALRTRAATPPRHRPPHPPPPDDPPDLPPDLPPDDPPGQAAVRPSSTA